MDYMSNKALIIAVSLIVTMAIASAVLLIINQVVTVYGQVYETDTSIQSGFDEFDSYDNTQKTALDVLNTVKKYKNNSLVSVVDGNGSPYNEEALKRSLNVGIAGHIVIGDRVLSGAQAGIVGNRDVRKGHVTVQGSPAIDAKKLRDCSLLLDVRKNDLSLERIFCGYLHVVFCTFVDEWVHIIIHSGILLKINLDKFWIGTLFWLVNGI